MKYHSIESQNKFYLQRIANIDNLTHDGDDDKGRLVYCETNKRVYKGGNTTWEKLSTPYDILPQTTKILIGSQPLPTGWNIDTRDISNKIILITDTLSEIVTSGGTWTIESMETGGNHRHRTGGPDDTRLIGYSDIYGFASSNIHRHYTPYGGTHQHTFDGTWRPPAVKYCVAEYA